MISALYEPRTRVWGGFLLQSFPRPQWKRFPVPRARLIKKIVNSKSDRDLVESRIRSVLCVAGDYIRKRCDGAVSEKGIGAWKSETVTRREMEGSKSGQSREPSRRE